MKTQQTNFKETEIGLIPEEWEVLPIDSVANVVGGGTPSTSRAEYFGGSIPWITPRDLSSFQGRFIERGERNISEEGFNSSGARVLPKGSVLLSSRAPVGYLAIADGEVTTNQGFQSLVPSSKVNNLFLYYLLKNNTQKLIDHSSGSTFQELSGKTLRSLTFAFPDIQEQHRIASILSSLDSRIELNRQINANLEKMASALFKRWFVDFEFPDEKGRPYKASGGKMVETEMGEVPEGWKVGVLTDVCILNPPYRMQKDAVAKYIEMKDLPEVGSGIKGHIERRFTAGSKFGKYDTLLARITPCLENGKTGFVDFLEEGEIGWGSTEFIVMHPKSKEFEEYLYLLSRSKDFREFAIQSMSGSSGRQRVQVDRLMTYEIIVPSDDIITGYHELASAFFAEMYFNNDQTKVLMKIRDSLLPRLMSGKIRAV